jgi:Pyruvate/2-oxoglutarate dehydrogenase complex, dehydrogenase (E1) component, eukaryotic type, alpha subunit
VYREESEVERWKQKDPIPRFETFLRDQNILDDERVATIEQAVEDEVADVITTAEEMREPDPAEMFASVYESMPGRLDDQLRYLSRLREEHGDDTLTDD